MATFISLLSFTDQGIRDVKESPRRYEAFRVMAVVRRLLWVADEANSE